MRGNGGFTLIELIVTMAVIGVLAGIALPTMNALVEQQRTLAAASSLMSHMALARVAAVTRNRRTVLCPSLDGERCLAGTDWSAGWILFLDDDGNHKPDGRDEILRVDMDPTSKHLRVVSSKGREQLRYLPDGSSAGSNLTISICNERDRLLARVVVNNLGRPRSERAAAGQPCPN